MSDIFTFMPVGTQRESLDEGSLLVDADGKEGLMRLRIKASESRSPQSREDTCAQRRKTKFSKAVETQPKSKGSSSATPTARVVEVLYCFNRRAILSFLFLDLY